MQNKSLQVQQLDDRMQTFESLQKAEISSVGWIKTIRVALGMSLEQLGRKLSITKQSALDIEKREVSDSITLRALKEAAEALDMKFVYGFIPKDGSLEALIERKAKVLATKIVMRTNTTMQLEGQANSKERIEKAIEERTQAILNEMPKMLWD